MRISDWSSDVCSSDLLREVPAPVVDPDAPLQLLVTTLDYDNYRGQTAIGRIFAGKVNKGEAVVRIKLNGDIVPEKIQYLFVQEIGRASCREECVSTCRSRWSPYH